MRPISSRFKFTGDACADAVNTFAPEWIDAEQDALTSSWERLGSSVWMNPPYSKAKQMVRRARMMSLENGCTVVCLVPATADVEWFHEYALKHASELWFYRGRIGFVDPETKRPILGNPVGSVLVVFNGPQCHAGPKVGALCARSGKPINEADIFYWERMGKRTQPARRGAA